MGRALDLHQQVDLDVVQLVLLHRQDQVILQEHNFVLVAVFARLVHVVENFVLFLDEERALNLSLPLLFVVQALSVQGDVVELPRCHELLEGYLLDWAVGEGLVRPRTEAPRRRAILDLLDGNGLGWHDLLAAHGVLLLFGQFAILAHHVLQVPLQVHEVLLSDLEHLGRLFPVFK
jgi:hypothetical protein